MTNTKTNRSNKPMALIVALLVALSVSFVGTWLFQLAYEAIAGALNLPTFGYWVYFAGLMVLRMIVRLVSAKKKKA